MPPLWGGMSTLPHIELQHDQHRRRLLRWVRFRMLEAMAVKAGHRITLRFTEELAWFECACGKSGNLWHDSSNARWEALRHLSDVGIGLREQLDTLDAS